MPTTPPERAPLPQPESHQYRQVAESFGADADRYDRARPSYPAALVDRIVAASRGSDVLDVGCGTGIAVDAAGGSFTTNYATLAVGAVLNARI